MKNNYMIRAETLEDPPIEGHEALAILHYVGTDPPQSTQYANIDSDRVIDGCTADDKCRAINCPFKEYPSSNNIICVDITDFTPFASVDRLPVTSGNDIQRLFLNFGFEGARETSAINGRNLRLPAAPLIQEELNKDKCELNTDVCDSTPTILSPDCYCTHVREVTNGASVQLVLSAIGPSPQGMDFERNNFRFAHPVHLHGHYFHVVDVQYGEYSDSTNRLISSNSDITCGGTQVCIDPSWSAVSDPYQGRNISSAPPQGHSDGAVRRVCGGVLQG